MTTFNELLDRINILPVLTVTDIEMAVQLTEALKRGGINAVEITLRTSAALEALSEVKKAHPDMIVAAGTVNTVESVNAVAKAGVDFAVSPGMTPAILKQAKEINLPFLPGVATASEVLQAAEFGLEHFKLFPAAAVGGVALLKSLASPLSGYRFCPTGGLNQDNFLDYLKLPNVMCVGGSWMVPPVLVESKAWQQITELTDEAIKRANTLSDES